MTEPTRIAVAEAKRRFSDILGEVRYQGRRYVVERNGTPVAALVPLSDLPSASRNTGFLALAQAFQDAPEYADVLDEIVSTRRGQRSIQRRV